MDKSPEAQRERQRRKIFFKIFGSRRFVLKHSEFDSEPGGDSDIESRAAVPTRSELTEFLLFVESVGAEYGAKPGFWYELEQAAELLDIPEKVLEYRRSYRQALEEFGL